MAYITAAETKIIRDNLKKSYPEIKFSVRNRHHSSVDVTILKAPYKFELNGKDYRDVNQYHYYGASECLNHEGELVKPHTHQNILKGILAIISEKHWDKSDAMTDYFNCAFYYSLSIGSWSKPFEKVAKKTAKSVKRVAKKVVSPVVAVGASRYFPASRLVTA